MPHTITLIPGDGIGPEVTEAVQKILRASGVAIEPQSPDELSFGEALDTLLRQQRLERASQLDRAVAHAQHDGSDGREAHRSLLELRIAAR